MKEDFVPATIMGSIPDNDYNFCEAALEIPLDEAQRSNVVFLDDLPWDGNQCAADTNCCDTNNPP